MKFAEGSLAFMITNNIAVRRVVVAKATRDFYTISFYDDLNIHGAIRVRHNRLYASQKEAEAVLEERRSRMVNEPPTTPSAPAPLKTHWDYMM